MSVSVVIPVKNGAAYIREAIGSVLTQGLEVGEIIVVDDGSTDNTCAIVRAVGDSRIRLIANEGSGVSSARNAGAHLSVHEWLMFLDADDRLRPGAVELLVRAAGSAPQAVAIYGDYDRIDKDGRSIGMRWLLRSRAKPSGEILARIVAGNFIVNGGVMLIRSAVFTSAGGFDESLKYCEDWHCWCRLAALGEFKFVPNILLDYRVHPANTMNAALRTPQDFFHASDRVFGDCAIVNRLPESSVPSLRTAAELHLIGYAAAQALRFQRYRKAISYAFMAARRAPLAAPGVLFRIGLAYLGV